MATPERDRDERGRPKSARPRDALGRPLPRGARDELGETPSPSSPDEALRLGASLFNAGRFFQAHEAWEEPWHTAPAAERDFWQGITQIAVGFTHWQRGNPKGAVTLLRRGARRLEAYGDRHRGLDLRRLREGANAAADAIERDDGTPVEIPQAIVP